MNWTQQDAPLMDALKEHLMNRVVRFDVPGHKGGRGNHELADFLGERCVQIDVNSMKNLDNLCHPVSVLRDAQQLAAEAFGAANAFFIINGATGASQAMIMSVCKAGEKLIMPRNVHRSAINALVVNGAVPVYVDPGENKDLGIPLGMSVEAVERAKMCIRDSFCLITQFFFQLFNEFHHNFCSCGESLCVQDLRSNMAVQTTQFQMRIRNCFFYSIISLSGL